MIRINCFLNAKEGRLAEAMDAAKALTAESRRQDGCIAYDVFESATNPGALLICETWRDQTALDAHSASEPFKKYVGIMSDACELKIESFNY